MALDNMSPQPPMRLPGASDYAAECVRRATLAAQDMRVEWDQPYGPHARHQLDVWLPGNPVGAPVCFLIHGGALRAGQKEWMGAHAAAVVGAGAILVSPNYRLTPEVRAVDIIDDCFDALAWVYANIARFGGNPDALIVGGHSSGGHMAGLLALRVDELAKRGIPVSAIRASMLISSVVSCFPEDYSENSPGRTAFDEKFASMDEAAAATIFTHLDRAKVPFHVCFGEIDAPDLIAQNWRLIADMSQRRQLVGSDVVQGGDHFTTHLMCTEPDSGWMAKLREFLF